MLGGIGLGYRLFQLQVTQAPELLQKAQAQQEMVLRPFIPRRTIVDRRGRTVALDQLTYTLYVHPAVFVGQEQAVADQLAPILERSPTTLLQTFSTAPTGIRLARGLSAEAAQKISALFLDGVDLVPQQQRLYPRGDQFAELVGYVDIDHQGQAGIEYRHEAFLERPARTLKLEAMGNGTIQARQLPSGALQLDDLQLQLTVDGRLQRATRQALRQNMAKFRAKRGTVLVMDAWDGALLALVTEPTYDANHYYDADVALFKNWAVTDLYEPGSTFKPINVAIALEADAITPGTLIYDEGKITVGGWPIYNHDYWEEGGHGLLTISKILERSSNVGMVHIMQRLDLNTYYDWLVRLGLGDRTGIDLPFEALGNLKSREVFTWGDIEGATHAFGQGFALTPMRLAQLHGALANGGLLVTPHVVRGLVDGEATLYRQPQRPEPRRVFSPETTQAVLSMMENVVTKGTGKAGQVNGYRIAGKTGTAQKVSSGSGAYGAERITSFVGILPLEAPRYVVLAVVDEPQGGLAYGSTVSAPIVKAVMESLVILEKLAPTGPVTPPELKITKGEE